MGGRPGKVVYNNKIWMINLEASWLQRQPVAVAEGPFDVTSQGSFELHKQKHQEMIRTSGNAKSILV